MLQRRERALLAVEVLAEAAGDADRHRRVGVLEIDAVGVDQLARVAHLAAQADGLHGVRHVVAAGVLRMVRAMQKYMMPSGMRETCMRIMPGVRNAPSTFQRGQAPLKRAKRMPEALKRFEMLPATSMRIMWNGTPSAPGRRSVVSRWQTCSKLAPKRCAEHLDVVALGASRPRGTARTA